jgi:O-antigen ligase
MMVAFAAATRRWLGSLAIIAAMGLAAVALLLSLSRMSLIGAAVGLALAVVLLPRPELLRTGAAVAVTVVVVAVAGLAVGGQPLRQRIDSILHPTSSHVSTASGDLAREHIWLAAVETAEANPVAGVGFGNVTKFLPRYGAPVTASSHAHDTYLQFFAEGGVLALIALLGVIGAAFVDLSRAFTTHRVWVAGATGALVATLLSWITDVEVRYVQVSAMVAVLLGLIAALAVRRASSPAPEASGAPTAPRAPRALPTPGAERAPHVTANGRP